MLHELGEVRLQLRPASGGQRDRYHHTASSQHRRIYHGEHEHDCRGGARQLSLQLPGPRVSTRRSASRSLRVRRAGRTSTLRVNPCLLRAWAEAVMAHDVTRAASNTANPNVTNFTRRAGHFLSFPFLLFQWWLSNER